MGGPERTEQPRSSQSHEREFLCALRVLRGCFSGYQRSGWLAFHPQIGGGKSQFIPGSPIGAPGGAPGAGMR